MYSKKKKTPSHNKVEYYKLKNNSWLEAIGHRLCFETEARGK